ncbi:MAG TPA: SRPBCC domain-containing protein [Gemmatimonadaceae bacterium]
MTAPQAPVSLRMTRVIKAKRDKVFQAWIKPETLKQWMGPQGIVVPVVKIDARVGGQYRIEMESTGDGMGNAGDKYVVVGVYEEIVPNEKLVFTWMWERPDATKTVVTILLKDKDGGTELTLIHERFGSTDEMKSHESGWTSSMEKLAGVLE